MPSAPRKPRAQTVQTAHGPVDLPLLSIAAPQDYAIIPATLQNLMCSHGQVGERIVLAPYVSFRLDRSVEVSAQTVDDLETEVAFSGSLSYENMAFLIMDIARDYSTVMGRLKVFASGDLQCEPVRLSYASYCLTKARTAIDQALKDLEDLAVRAEQSEREDLARLNASREAEEPKPRARPAAKTKPVATSRKAKRATA